MTHINCKLNGSRIDFIFSNNNNNNNNNNSSSSSSSSSSIRGNVGTITILCYAKSMMAKKQAYLAFI